MFDAGVIRSRFAMALHLVLTGRRTELRAGTYNFSGNVTLPLVLNVVTKKQSLQGEVEITLLEGWTADDMANTLSNNLQFTADDYNTLTASPSNFSQAWLDKARNTGTLQGFLFPDTYRFFVDASASDVINTQLDTFNQRFTDQMKTDLNLAGRNIYEAVILASIVEKEAQTPEDKAIVAGIFWKRFDAGKPLESDATINYLTEKADETPSFDDLQVESAYNTYRNVGLPPTPICNPGLASLQAVVYPTATDYWFFLTTPDDEMKYSATYEEHLQTKNQYYP